MRVMTTEGPSRARAAPGALGSLLAWLRRPERSSSDSLSSAGSDRSVASFAFLAPNPRAAPAPAAAPLPAPSDSYRKRVHDRHLQRQHDRDLTLHRKYGLYYGYDAFSLPPAHKRFAATDDERDRERRATSESLPRRGAHVPGKRRAPLPPARPQSLVSTASLTRRYSRKRPAPQPPVKLEGKSKENIPIIRTDIRMNPKAERELRPLYESNDSNGCKTEKHSKKNNDKDTKIRTEKSFLKQIFENKKRISTIEPAPERILPSISELDKQAAEIIELCKLKPLENNNNNMPGTSTREQTWFCTRCLRKYNSTVVTCQYCLPEQKRLSNMGRDIKPTTSCNYSQTEIKSTTNVVPMNKISVIGEEEKQKLKEMLKEMKDSLPKKPKHDSSVQVQQSKTIFKFEPHNSKTTSQETPTLRIGSTVDRVEKTITSPQPSTSKRVETSTAQISDLSNIEQILPKVKSEKKSGNVIITQHVVLVAPQMKAPNCPKLNVNFSINATAITSQDKPQANIKVNTQSTTSNVSENNLHTPLKISSLLNPVYVPKKLTSEKETTRALFFSPTVVKNPHLQMDNTKISQIEKSTNETSIYISHSKQNSTSTQNTEKSNLKASVENGTKYNTKTELQPVVKESNLTASPVPIKEVEKCQVKPSPVPAPQLITSNNMPSHSFTNSNDLPDKSKLLNSNMIRFNFEQHSRRRDLVNQLEQSIAKGDERAAADAATKLAQLRLACSVLSFSSQIMGEGSKAPPLSIEREQSVFKSGITEDSKQKQSPSPLVQPLNKVDAAVQPDTNVLSNVKTKSKEVDPIKNDAQDSKPTCSTSKQENLGNKNPGKNEDDLVQHTVVIKPSASSQVSNESEKHLTTIQVWVEDREATRGPVRLRIPRQAVMGELRREAETSLGLAGALQRWIVGRALCTDDRTPLVTLAGPDLAAPFYLCVVESGITESNCRVPFADTTVNIAKAGDVYSELVQLEQHAVVSNAEPFECSVCMEERAIGAGAVLRECVHTFCRECLSNLVCHCEEPIVSCPAMGCPGVLQEREIRALVTRAEYEKWLARGLVAAESGTRNAFHCRTRDCTGWAFCDPGVRRFPCPVCKRTNCIPCQNIHEGATCEQYRAKLKEAASTSNQTDEGTQTLLNSLIAKGEALQCPECSAIIMKKWGCDWVKCSACKTEICWVTRGRRWGPDGKGDTSGGCRCGVDGKRCHPSCAYCH